ncbi:putative cytochrome c' [Thauera linaloolentis 47Lol = DSM 12138]|uniref:Putative cytochrome c n=1 Tax=Thauera linaloolentis (strain DSM 12138 / JCM 21573 / CCUG 41526 / CIP 105981 / IAM 15112 / NBRC 102519 / 47Lol) TaxID=1123367 RepID=N6ZAE0_THAL4|nr:putative cytochrome c' [Thauera linaloolentis 47Lol = DSM 12138]
MEDTRPGQPVKHRQDAFKAMLRSFEPMGTMLRTDRYQADEFVRLANELVSLREAPWAHFTPDTLYPPTKARAAVWERAQDFEHERQDFYEATDALAQAAQTRDKGRIQTAYDKVHASCKSCHSDFKK